MPQAKSVLAFEELIYGILDPARDSPNGIALTLPTAPEAFSLVMRLRTALSRLAAQSRQIFPPEDPAHGLHGYESLVIQHTNGSNVIYLRKLEASSILETIGATMTKL